MDLKNLLGSLTKKSDKAEDKVEDKDEAITRKKRPKNSVQLFAEKLQQELSRESLWTSCFVAAVLASLLFAYILKNNFHEYRVLSHLETQAEQLADNVQNSIKQVQQLAATIIAENPDAENIDELVDSQISQTLRVKKVEEPIDDIVPTTEFPGINFATFDMLKQTSESQQEQMPEIHLYGQSNQYLNFVYIHKPEAVYVVVSYPVDMIIKSHQMQFENSQLSLIQQSGTWSSVELQKWGHVDPNSATNNQEIKIPNSNFQVHYAVQKSYSGLFNLSLLSSIIALGASLILAVATWVKRSQRLEQLATQRKKTLEEPVYVHTPKAQKSGGLANLEDKEKSHQDSGGESAPDGPLKLPDKSIFKAYDIRGIVDKTLTVEAVQQIGHAIGSENLNRGRKTIVVARDGRLSGPTLLEALIKGIARSGCDVINIGAVPTGVLYFSTHHLETGSGVMLTGSHNPADYNGLKIMLDGETLAGKLITNLYDMIANNDLLHGKGDVQEF